MKDVGNRCRSEPLNSFRIMAQTHFVGKQLLLTTKDCGRPRQVVPRPPIWAPRIVRVRFSIPLAGAMQMPGVAVLAPDAPTNTEPSLDAFSRQCGRVQVADGAGVDGNFHFRGM